MNTKSAGRVLVETVARCLGPLREEVAFLGAGRLPPSTSPTRLPLKFVPRLTSM